MEKPYLEETAFERLVAIEEMAETPAGAAAVSPEDAKLYASFWHAFVARLLQTKNPLGRWIQYYMARNVGEPVPESVLRYFDEVAKKITIDLISKPPPSNADAAIADALGFGKSTKGRGHPLNAGWHFKRDLGICVDCAVQIRILGEKHGADGIRRAAFQNVAERYGMSASQVRRIYNELMKGVPEGQ